METSYVFTDHFIIRLKERFAHLNLSWNNQYSLYAEIKDIIKNSHDEKRYLNDPEYMFYLYERYGYDSHYEFLANKDYNIVFVVLVIGEGRKVIKTCMVLNEAKQFIPNKKFTGGERKERIHKKRERWPNKELKAIEEYEKIKQEPEKIIGTIPSKKETYRLINNKLTGKIHAIKCLKCSMISYNENDIREKYCGSCHEFHELSQKILVNK